MKKIMKNLISSCVLAAMVSTPVAVMAESAPKLGNIRVVIGSKSTGGDTYQASNIIAQALAEKLDTNIKVDAVGSTAAFKALKRIKNGSTIMIFHDQSYLGNLYGTAGYYNIFEEFQLGASFAINPGNCYLVHKSSPYYSIGEIIDAAGKGEEFKIAIQPGGVSEIGFSALKNAVKLKYPGSEKNIIAVNTGSQSDKNQQLFDGQANMINCTVQANEQYTRLPESDQKAMRFVWLTAKNSTLAQANPDGLGATSRDDLMKFVEPNALVPMNATENFTFDKEFFFIFNKDTDPKIVAYIDQALTEVFADGKVQETFKKSFFIPNFKPSTEFGPYLQDKNDKYKDIISSIHE